MSRKNHKVHGAAPTPGLSVRQDHAFLVALNDLDELPKQMTLSNVQRLSVVLRRLLLDGTPLSHRVNSSRKLPIRYHFNAETSWVDRHTAMFSLQDGFDPKDVPPNRLKEIEGKLSDLLSARVMFVGGTWFSVKDLIVHAATFEGGAHDCEPTTERDKTLWQVNALWNVLGTPMALRSLFAIARVVRKGLEPLRARVLSEAGAPPQSKGEQ